ncbi:MAG: hypothetical protein WCA78_15710 [Rhizomicrobium sp.]
MSLRIYAQSISVPGNGTFPISDQAGYDWIQILGGCNYITFSLDGGPQLAAQSSLSLEVGWNTVLFTNSNSFAQSVVVRYGSGIAPPPIPPLRDLCCVMTFGNNVVPATGQTKIANSNGKPYETTLGLLPGAANGVTIGDATVSATNGIWLAPGQNITLPANEDMYAYNAGAAAVNLQQLSFKISS